jgi:YrbI family 3-deoxy-D-manno-octulosonate 8-phosphate phosphatase
MRQTRLAEELPPVEQSRATINTDGRADAAAATPSPSATALATAIIPARGGSQGLPGKNLARVGGVPLVVRAVQAALRSERIGRVVVTTDDVEIAESARVAGAEIVDRPHELADSEASSESALLHALGVLEASVDEHNGRGDDRNHRHRDITVFIQATSPFIDPADLDAAIERVHADERDVVFSAAPTHVFLWRGDAGARSAVGVNHDAAHRQRRQDRTPEFAETGAFYVLRTDGFVRAGHRFFGRVGVQPVHPDHAIEIDDADDLERARALAPDVDRRLAASGATGADQRHPQIDVDALVTDFDGVHTDDTVMVDQLGRETVRVSRADGHGIARVRAAGIPVLILSAEENPVVERRAEKLGVECAQGVAEKGAVLRAWAADRGIRLDRIAYLGNDRGDLPALGLVGWPIAVPDAAPEALAAARHVLANRGGHGAVRELADLILAARQHAIDPAHPARA